MKTKTTTPTRNHEASTTDQSSALDNMPSEKGRKPVVYPNLEGFVPEDYTTTHDQAAYGKSADNRKE